MPLNIPGILVPFQLIVNPRIILPSLAVKDIRHIDFAALRKAGYRGAVFDKDNCLTLPHEDTIVPEIQKAWNHCRETFGEGNVLIVSNSAGTYLDPGEIQCESVTFHTSVPVLRHQSFKPAYSCIEALREYFASLKSPIPVEDLIVVGDRIFTDVVMANRMRGGMSFYPMMRTSTRHKTEPYDEGSQPHRPNGPLAIWTTDVWKREAMGMRYLERKLVEVVQRWTTDTKNDLPDTTRFIKAFIEPDSINTGGRMAEFLRRITRA